uniref:Secreted protein n=1 Tax=Paramormyrops kingsleyae TaxID=1676925 RepID=A0A3B3RPL9_9TELE
MRTSARMIYTLWGFLCKVTLLRRGHLSMDRPPLYRQATLLVTGNFEGDGHPLLAARPRCPRKRSLLATRPRCPRRSPLLPACPRGLLQCHPGILNC